MEAKIEYQETKLADLTPLQLDELITLYEAVYAEWDQKVDRDNVAVVLEGFDLDPKWIFARDASSGDLVGFITVATDGSLDCGVCSMYNLGVKETYRNKGIGKTLFGMAKKDCKGIEFYSLDGDKLLERYKKWGATVIPKEELRHPSGTDLIKMRAMN